MYIIGQPSEYQYWITSQNDCIQFICNLITTLDIILLLKIINRGRMNTKRKFQQLKTYSKIMKVKKSTGEIQQFHVKPSQQMEEEQANIPSNSITIEKNEQLNQEDFEDQFSDEYEDEEAWVDESSSEGEKEVTDQSSPQNQMIPEEPKNTKSEKVEVFTGTNKNLKKGEFLDFDNNAYDMLHRLNTQWPSLSIDFICQDSPFIAPQPFQVMDSYPYEVYTVQGTCNNTKKNSIYLTKWLKLQRTKFDSEIDGEEVDNEKQINDDEEAKVIVQQIPTTFNVNRLKSLKNSPIVAFWNQAGEINIMDLTQNFEKLVNNIGTKKKPGNAHLDETTKLAKITSQSEGYAINWNPHRIGQLATGNTANVVEVFDNNENYTQWKKTYEYKYHKSSVEDIVFSPTEQSVFASCSSDGTLQIVDMRVGKFDTSQICVRAHDKDVNVCDWNKIATHLIVTGSDDCSVKVWDLRMCSKNQQSSEELIKFKWHNQPITSIKFQPNEESMIAVASQDNSISIWDMSMENEQEDPQIPNELMFIHQGQQQIKQLCFHPVWYEMIVSSAQDGINIFKPSYEMPEQLGEGDEDLKKMKPIPQKELDQYLQKLSLND